MKILLTGFTSFIGWHLFKELSSNLNFIVFSTYRNKKHTKLNQDGAISICLDLNNREDYKKLPQEIDVVIHVAASCENSDPVKIFQDNIIGTNNLIEYALRAKAKKFIFFSTMSVYGDVSVEWVNENTSINKPGYYGISKFFSEESLKRISNELPVLALRLPAVVGVGATRHWLACCLEKIRYNETISIYNPESYFNNLVHIDSLKQFISGLLKKNWSGFRVYTLGASDKIKLIEVIKFMISLANSNSKIVINENSKKAFLISSEQAKHMGYNPKSVCEMLETYVLESIKVPVKV